MMLNELLVVARGLDGSGIEVVARHPDVKDVGKRPTLRVRLGLSGRIAGLDPVPRSAELWTFGKGNKLRFPFIQPQAPLLRLPDAGAESATPPSPPRGQRRERLLQVCRTANFDEEKYAEWPGARNKRGGWSQRPSEYLDALREKCEQLRPLRGSDGESVLETIERFLAACTSLGGGANLLRRVVERLIGILEKSSSDDWLRIAEPILLRGGGALYFDVPDAEFARPASDPRQVTAVSQVLTKSDEGAGSTGVCGLSGRHAHLVSDTFPELVLPVIGKTILFSRFDAIPSNARYRRFGASSFPVAREEANRLAAALRYLTRPERQGRTWRSVPRESPGDDDLLLAFVDGGPDLSDFPIADDLGREDFFEEAPVERGDGAESIAVFEKRAQRVIDAVKAKPGIGFWNTPVVALTVLRKVDPANRKVIYAGTPTIGELYRSAFDWVAGERNVPSFLTLLVLRKGEREPRRMSPPHIAPLGVIAFTKQTFLRNGLRPASKKKEQVGLPAGEAFGLFLENDPRRVRRVLRLALVRRTSLVSGTAHAQRRGLDSLKHFDRREALRSMTLLGVLLHKLGRTKEVDMHDAAFKLGQLLAAADVVHAGYCADVRGGDLPPSLLGNQVFTMAQTAPAKALAMLCRRWRPYDGWAKRASRDTGHADSLVDSKNRDERTRGWDIINGRRCAKELGPLANSLAPALTDCAVDDQFRAELLLGYLAGLPKTQKPHADRSDHTSHSSLQEN